LLKGADAQVKAGSACEQGDMRLPWVAQATRLFHRATGAFLAGGQICVGVRTLACSCGARFGRTR